jgi:hypothetical protein
MLTRDSLAARGLGRYDRIVRLVLVLASLALLVSGCPRTDPPADRMGGMPCTTNDDCNPGRTCGELALCITGLCESGHTWIVACPHQGMRPAP